MEPEVKGSAVKESGELAPVAEPIAVPPESPRPHATTQPVRANRRPMFLSSDDKGEDAPTPQKAQKALGPQQPVSEPAWSPSPEIVAVEPTPVPRLDFRR
ncbi:hypothetical protein JB92DRAFT_3106386 [Gautieria morchelliformis]|nr:hypothetical protein JB92DRAFT_3106386 [Gautieria morchelliformis]